MHPPRRPRPVHRRGFGPSVDRIARLDPWRRRTSLARWMDSGGSAGLQGSCLPVLPSELRTASDRRSSSGFCSGPSTWWVIVSFTDSGPSSTSCPPLTETASSVADACAGSNSVAFVWSGCVTALNEAGHDEAGPRRTSKSIYFDGRPGFRASSSGPPIGNRRDEGRLPHRTPERARTFRVALAAASYFTSFPESCQSCAFGRATCDGIATFRMGIGVGNGQLVAAANAGISGSRVPSSQRSSAPGRAH